MESPTSAQAPPTRPGRKKVSAACQRCRRQKLKCDVQRPCTLCVRAEVECIDERPNRWRIQNVQTPPKRARPPERDGDSPRRTKRARRAPPLEESSLQIESPENIVVATSETSFSPTADDAPLEQSIATQSHTPDGKGSEPWPSNSAAMSFLDEAFQRQDATTPGEADTSAFAASQWTIRSHESRQSKPRNERLSMRDPDPESAGQPRFRRHRQLNLAEQALLSMLPGKEPATLLIDNYFHKIHWCMLIFFQSEFRERFKHLVASPQEDIRRSPGVGFLSLVLAVCLTSLQYTSEEQKTKLRALGVDPGTLHDGLLDTLRLRVLDYVSSGSIEAVQTCILLGSFYLYHGEPELAWPICGCGLRIAQALNLHRRAADREPGIPDLDNPAERAVEARKRCWWAIYEIETFCSMLYGFPLSIVDGDCDVRLPTAYPLRSKDSSWDSARWKEAGQATLLSFKGAMAQLSIIVKSALSRLYGAEQKSPRNEALGVDGDDSLPSLATNITDLDSRLQDWWHQLPRELQLDKVTDFESSSPQGALSNTETILGREHRDHLFRVQALSLKLAFENARILVHRPLLSYKSTSTMDSAAGTHPCFTSIQICRDAALEIAKVGSTTHFQEVADTYAVSFVALHLFTAGVTLSIMTSLKPLSQESFEAKMGLRQLMNMHSQLKTKSIVAEQGFGILKRLMVLVMSKETERMLDFERPRTRQRDGQGSSSAGLLSMQPAIQSGQNPTPNLLEASRDLDGLQRGGFGASVEATQGMSADLGFREDPLITQALLDFEQAMSSFPEDVNGTGLTEFGDQFTESCFGAHDQGWIWNLRN